MLVRHTRTWVLIQYIITNVTLYCRSILFMQVENPSQQPDAIYSLVVSVESSPPIHEVYIDAHFHNTALKVKKVFLNLSLSLILILTLS